MHGNHLQQWRWQSSFVMRLSDTLYLVLAIGETHARTECATCSRKSRALALLKAFQSGSNDHFAQLFTSGLFHRSISCSCLPLTLEPPATPLDCLLLCDWDDGDVHLIKAHTLQHILRIRIHVKGAIFGVLGKVEGRNFRHILIFAFTLFFLQLEGDASDRSPLDPLHQMGGVARDLDGDVSDCRESHLQIKQRRGRRTLFRNLFEAMMAISSHILLLVSKSRVSLG
jgi:hypothetical protein